MADQMTMEEIRSKLISLGVKSDDIGPIDSSTQNIYIKRIEKLENEHRVPYKQIFGRMRNETADVGSGSRSDGLTGRHFTRGVTGTNNGANGRHYSNSSSGVPVGSWIDPNSQRGSRESSNTISDYLVSPGDPQHTDLMEISDDDMSENEGFRKTGLHKKYSTQTQSTPGSSISSTAADIDPCERKSQSDKKSSFISWISWNQLPNLLLVAFIVFSVALFVSYLLIKHQSSVSKIDIALIKLTCEKSHNSGNVCFPPEEMPSLRQNLGLLYDILSEHTGRQMCEHSIISGSGRQLTFSYARIMLNARLSTTYRSTFLSKERWSSLIKLLINLHPRTIDIAIYDNNRARIFNDASRLPEEVTYLEGLRPKMSLWCRLKMGIIALVFHWVTYILCLVSSLVVYFFKKNRFRKIEKSISELLQDQIRYFIYGKGKFIPLSRIRSVLQQTHPKLKDNQFWEEVKQFMYKNEPLIELKETIQHGEILQWRCQPGRQSSAVQRGNEVTGSTEYLNVDVEKFDENDRYYLSQEVMSRIIDTDAVKDIQLSTDGVKVIVCVIYSSREAAGRAFRRINANYSNCNPS